MKTITIEDPSCRAEADVPHEALIRLQFQVDKEFAQAHARAEDKARKRAVNEATSPRPQSRVRFAYD